MEVHAHTHTPRKKWSHYFWEFLMLFLAVFCGFLAENQREHMIEHKREKQFMRSLLNDLQLDIAWLDTVTKSAKARILNIDSAILILVEQQTDEIPLQTYQQLRRSMTQVMFFANNGTMTQLKNAGGMRLIRKREVVDLLENYDRQMRRSEMRREITQQHIHDFNEALNKAIDGKDIFNKVYGPAYYTRESKQTIKLNGQYVNELINQSISNRQRTVSDTVVNVSIKLNGIRLVDFIRKQYNLK